MKYVIIGGGITGLLSAKLLRNRHPKAEIIVLEKESKLGGLLSGITYDVNEVYFDTGTHIFQETGNSEIDGILINSISSDNLIHYPVGKGDLAGLLLNNKLQKDSHFPDLRNDCFYEYNRRNLREHLKTGVKIENLDPCNSLIDVANGRFGKYFTDKFITPVFESVFKLPINEISSFALSLTGWTRVILDDYDDWINNILSNTYKSIVAVPDQRKLPFEMHHGRRSYYSKKNGSNALITGLKDSLTSSNVEIITGVNIGQLNQSDDRNLNITYNHKSRSVNYDKLIISTGIFGAAKLFGINDFYQSLDKPFAHWIIDIILVNPCESDLCYLYSLDRNSDWFRITNYNALIDNSVDKRLTIEVLGEDLVNESFATNLLKNLTNIKFLKCDKSSFINCRKLPSGFPTPSTKNFRKFAEINRKLQNYSSDSILFCGIGTAEGVFFSKSSSFKYARKSK